MRSLRILTVLAASGAAAAPAQLDPYYWSTTILAQGTCQICVYDSSGAAIASFAVGGFTSNPVMAKHPAGLVWVADLGTSTIRPYTLAGPAGPPVVQTTGAVAIAADALGDLWTLHGSLFSPGYLERRDVAGTLLQSIPIPGVVPAGLEPDPFGNLWVQDGIFGVRRVDPIGGIAGPNPPGIAGVPQALKVDPQGNAWMVFLSGSGAGTTTLVKTDNLLNPLFTAPVIQARALALDGRGNPRVLLGNGFQQSLAHYRADGSLAFTTLLVSGRSYTGLAVDTGGRTWLAGTNTGFLDVYDCAGNALTSIGPGPGGPIPAAPGIGDRTGIVAASVLAPGADLDGDGVAGTVELQVGTDPLNFSSAPPVLALAGTAGAGATVPVGLSVPAEPGAAYILGAALGTAGIDVAPPPLCRQVPLSFDPLLAWWLSPANSVAGGVAGLLDGNGAATVSLAIPAAPGLSGLTFYVAGITFGGPGLPVSAITAPLGIYIP